MARRLGHKVSIVDAHKVALKYNRAWREHTRFPTDGADWNDLPRVSDQELWDQGKPTINQGGTVSEGFAQLTFVFKNVSEEHADHWVRDFLYKNQLPHTYYEVEPTREDIVSKYTGGAHQTHYVRVIVRFEMDEVYDERMRQTS